LFNRKLLYLIILTSLTFSQYEYNLEDVNANSPTFGDNVWYPDFSNFITLHYFGTQGWEGWTSIYWQLSDFQELLHEEGYENVLIIGIGKDFLQDDFGEAFCQNSTLPLILDSSTDYINYVIQQQFDAQHKEVVILGTDGSILDRFVMPFNSIEPYEQQIYDTIVENYSSTSAESVDYSTQIQPIFNSSCTNCHGGDGGINLSSYDNVMNGGNSGDAVIPYDHSNSLLWQYVNSGFMPLGDNDLTDTQVNLIARWIDEGALSEPYEPLAGDVNDDGAVNILDIVQLANMILSDEYQGSGDLNDDGMLNILDIVQLVNIILRRTGWRK